MGVVYVCFLWCYGYIGVFLLHDDDGDDLRLSFSGEHIPFLFSERGVLAFVLTISVSCSLVNIMHLMIFVVFVSTSVILWSQFTYY